MGKRKKHSWPELPEPLTDLIIDNHAHLSVHEGKIPEADGLRLSLDGQLPRTEATNIVGVVSGAYEIPSLDPTMQIARVYERVYIAVATHLNEAVLHAGITKPSPDDLAPRQAAHRVPLDEAIVRVECFLKDPLAIAAGKSGLDYFRAAAQGREAQKRSFATHLELGVEVGLPVRIHDQDVHANILEVSAGVARVDQLIVFHCFSGDVYSAGTLIEEGWYVSFAGPLTYPVNEDLRAALVTMPRELTFVETDAPYLTPAPHRGSSNVSYMMAHTVRFIAELWDVDEEEACMQLMENMRRVYGA